MNDRCLSSPPPHADEINADLRHRLYGNTRRTKLTDTAGRTLAASELIARVLGLSRDVVDDQAAGKHGAAVRVDVLVAEAWLTPEGSTLERACELAGGVFVTLPSDTEGLTSLLRAVAQAKAADARSELALAAALEDGRIDQDEAEHLLRLETVQFQHQARLVRLLQNLVDGGDKS